MVSSKPSVPPEMTQEPGPSSAPVPSLRSKIGRVAAASAVALAFAQVVSLGQTIALAHLLSPSEVGLFIAGGVLTSFVGDFVEGVFVPHWSIGKTTWRTQPRRSSGRLSCPEWR